jgi:hypothetical protein
MGDYGIKVTKTGYDVASATALQQTFNSSYNCLKLASLSNFTSTASGNRDVVVAHGFSYKPAFMIWFEVSASGKWFAYGSSEDVSGADCYVFAFADATNVTFRLYSSSSKVIKVAYFLIVDPGE